MKQTTTQAQKIARFDALQASEDKLALALHDMVNGGFKGIVTVKVKDFDPTWQGIGFYRFKLSDRAMPLILVSYVAADQSDQVWVYTEAEILDKYRAHPTEIHSRILMAGYEELKAKYGTGPAIAA